MGVSHVCAHARGCRSVRTKMSAYVYVRKGRQTDSCRQTPGPNHCSLHTHEKRACARKRARGLQPADRMLVSCLASTQLTSRSLSRECSPVVCVCLCVCVCVRACACVYSCACVRVNACPSVNVSVSRLETALPWTSTIRTNTHDCTPVHADTHSDPHMLAFVPTIMPG